jgi:hypothetical protein
VTKVHDPVAEAVEKEWGEDSERLRLAKAFGYWATRTKSDAYRELFLHTAGVLREDERLIAGPRSTSEREKWFGLHEPKNRLHEPKNMPTVKRREPDELDEKGQVCRKCKQPRQSWQFTDAFGMPTEICAVCEFRYG